MIQFFRKIRQNLLADSKFSKYLIYAIGEIILVVVGILIAFQISNWNANVKNDSIKKEILKAVHHEFVINKNKLKAITIEHQKCYENSEVVIKMFPIDLKTVNLDSLKNRMLRSFGDWTFEPLQTRINFLISSSDFILMDDKELQTVLLGWESIYLDFHEDEQRALNFNINTIYPYLNKYIPMVVNLNDPRYDKSILQSIEFENLIKRRLNLLNDILYNSTNELIVLNETIDRIIKLTEPYSK